jgi:hypothetical protein
VTARKRTTVIAATCLAVSMAGSILLLRHIDRIWPDATAEDVLYIDSPKMVKRASLGFGGLMACIYWTRTVQYFGHRHFSHERSYNQLAPLLEITTALDPQMFPPYQFGASFLAPPPPNGAGQPERAIRLMEYGIEHNPDSWQLYYSLGFVYYTELKDYKKASEVFARGSQVPNAHPFMKVMAARMAENSGDLTTARLLWSAAFETTKVNDIRRNAMEHLRSIQVDEDVINLQAAVARFGQQAGRLPRSLSELASAEHLAGIPVDPDGQPYKLTFEGRIEVQHPENFPFITKGTPPGYKPSVLPTFHTKL